MKYSLFYTLAGLNFSKQQENHISNFEILRTHAQHEIFSEKLLYKQKNLKRIRRSPPIR